jgi:hypothetical protein
VLNVHEIGISIVGPVLNGFLDTGPTLSMCGVWAWKFEYFLFITFFIACNFTRIYHIFGCMQFYQSFQTIC